MHHGSHPFHPVPMSRSAKRVRLSSSDRDDDNSDDIHSSLIRPRRLVPTSQRSRDRESETVSLCWPVSRFGFCSLSPMTSIQLSQKFGALGFPVYSVYPGNGTGVPRPLCLLCGSGGLEKLLVCVVCCQSFHWFCVGLASYDLGNSDSFTCHSCTACSVCGLPNKVGDVD